MPSGLIGAVIDHSEKGLLSPVVRIAFDAAKNRRIEPFDLNLSKQNGAGDDDQIVACESPERLKIRPLDYLHQLRPRQS